MTEYDAMTPAQREARAKVLELLQEHFEGSVLICWGSADAEKEISDFWVGAYDGGSALALGLMEKYKRDILFPSDDRD